jgi:hypothetical protein
VENIYKKIRGEYKEMDIEKFKIKEMKAKTKGKFIHNPSSSLSAFESR